MSNKFDTGDDSLGLIRDDQVHETDMFSKDTGQEIYENGGNVEVYTDTDEKPEIVNTLVHDQEETKNKEYICDVCNAVCSHSSSIKEHMRQHKRSRPLYCKRCDQYFVLGDNFSAHKQQHEVEDAILCPVCGKRTKSMVALASHVKLHRNSDTFECGICCKTFTSSNLLIIHMETHSSILIYACDICHEGARSLKHLERHKMNIHNIYNTRIYCYGCTICSKRFKKRSVLIQHENTHCVSSGSQEYMNLSEDDMESKIRHEYLTEEPDNNTDFSQSGVVSKQADDLPVPVNLTENWTAIPNCREDIVETVHSLSNDNVENSVADIEETSNSSKDLISECDIASSARSSHTETPTSADDHSQKHGEKLRTFIDEFVADIMADSEEEIVEDTECMGETDEENDESKSYKCDLCSHEFEGCKAIKAHMLRHNNLKPHHCASCDLYFVLARNMRSHLIQHEVEDPLVCQLCNEVFHTSEGLNSHSLTHLEYFPFKCGVCQRGFQTQDTYNLHMRFHTNTAFECSVCMDTFPSKQSMQVHMRNKHFIYEKRYRFGCDMCEMRFQRSEILKRHKRYIHNVSWSELIPKKLRKQFQRKRGGKGFL